MSTRASRIVAAVLAACLAAGCTSPGTRVILLPQEGGGPSAVAVRSQSGEQTLSAPYQRATALAGAASAPTLDTVDAARVRADNRALFDLLPRPPQRYTVYFDAGGAALTPASQAAMDEALAAATGYPGGDIVVTGHTDTLGSPAQNDDLSRRRAQMVRQMFIDRQFPPARVEAGGRGERDLAVPTADEVPEPRNRRVTIEVR